MKDLSRHIEYLLLDHDRVIYPDLGTFIASYISSKWNEEEDLLLPPSRSVSFDPQSCQDDGLFISTLARRYRISEEDATLLCTEYLESINQELDENGMADLGSIGVFIREDEQSPLTFAPSLAGATTPGLYGLDTVHLPRIAAVKQPIKVVSTSENRITSDRDHITIRINRNVLNYVTAVAASIILFFAISTPVYNTDMTSGQEAQTEFFMPANLQPVRTVESSKAEQTTSADSAESTQEETNTKQETDATLSAEAAKTGSYAVVLASAISLKNAQRYTENLRNRGYKAEVMDNGKMVRVIIPGFSSAEEVHQTIVQMQSESREFNKAWTLKIDN